MKKQEPQANETLSKQLELAKLRQVTEKDLIKMGKAVNAAITNSEIEVAKAVATLASRGNTNLTPEVIKILAGIVVSVTERFVELPEDKLQFIDDVCLNIKGLFEFTQKANEENEEKIQKIAEEIKKSNNKKGVIIQ